MRIETTLSDSERAYTGPELRPHFLLTELKLKGHAMGAFIGPCEVQTGELVDWEDRLANDFIRAKLMVHFIGEFFEMGLSEGVTLQRLFMAICGEEIAKETGERIERDGDDLFWTDSPKGEKKKLSVSIVTASPVSKLLHAGINIDAAGAPVAAAGLQDLGLADVRRIKNLISRILGRFQEECASIEWACAKVRPVM